jgi:hypothetical protein
MSPLPYIAPDDGQEALAHARSAEIIAFPRHSRRHSEQRQPLLGLIIAVSTSLTFWAILLWMLLS